MKILTKIKSALEHSPKHFFTEDDVFEICYKLGIDDEGVFEQAKNSELFDVLIYDVDDAKNYDSGILREVYPRQECNSYQEFVIVLKRKRTSSIDILSQDEIEELFV